MSYDKTRLANFGRNVAADYARWQKSSEKMMEEIVEAKASGLSAEAIIKALLGRCTNRTQMLNILSVISAMVQMGQLNDEYAKIIEKGVLPRRI